jgi:hypothetical protein
MPKLTLSERIELSNEAMNEAATQRLARADAVLARTGNEVIFIHCQASNQPDLPIADKLYDDFLDGWTESEVIRWALVALGALLFLGCLWYVVHVLDGGLL